MTYLKQVILVLVLFCTKFVVGQVELEWVYTYDNIGWFEYARDITTDNLGNIYVTGESTRTNNPMTDYDIATIKLNSAGEEIWVKRLNRGINDVGKAIITDNTGNVYVTGRAGGKLVVIKYNTDGEEQWISDTLSGNVADMEADDSGYIFIAGYKNNGEMFLLKFDNNGNVIWEQDFGSTFFEFVTVNKLAISDNKIFIVGAAHTDSTSDDGFLISYDTDGSLLWKITHNGNGNGLDGFNSITKDSQNYIIATGFEEDSLRNGKIVTCKYSSEGKLEWLKSFDYKDYYDVGNIVLTDSNNNVYVGGYVEEIISNVISRKFALVKYDKSGNFLWFRDLPPDTLSKLKIEYMALDSEANIYCMGRYNDQGYYKIKIAKYSSKGDLLYDFRYPADNKLAEPSGLVVQGKDEFLICGYTYGVVTPADYLVLKYSIPTFVSNEKISPNQFNLEQNYPNPFNPSTIIKYAVSNPQFVVLKVYDVLGNEIAVLVNEEKPPGTYEVEFSARGGSASGGDASSLPSGVYFYQLKSGYFVKSRKMILLK